MIDPEQFHIQKDVGSVAECIFECSPPTAALNLIHTALTGRSLPQEEVLAIRAELSCDGRAQFAGETACGMWGIITVEKLDDTATVLFVGSRGDMQGY